MSAGDARQRLDVWLWRARLFKTRAEATRCIVAGGLRIERAGRTMRVEKPAAGVSPGDGLTLARAGCVRTFRVLSLPERRGPPAEARTHYLEITLATEALDEAPPPASSSLDL